MLTLAAVKHLVKTRIVRRTPATLESVADKTWEIAPGMTSVTLPAIYLANQLERVTGWEFADEHPRRKMEGGQTINHGPTRGFLVANALLVDGRLYARGASTFLKRRSSSLPRIHVPQEIDRAAIYCTDMGILYFAGWMIDCLTYPLAVAEGMPVTAERNNWPHIAEYERRLDMKPTQLDSAFFRELAFFDDVGQNRNKQARAIALRDKLLSGVQAESHPGVFILRGLSGSRRVLNNEMELAELLRDRRGFRILDPTKADVGTILATCAGAQTVVGVEGSHLAHGVNVLPPGGPGLLALQPPNRFVGVYKDMMYLERQRFGFVVGIPDGDAFRIDPIEMERTLDLMAAS